MHRSFLCLPLLFSCASTPATHRPGLDPATEPRPVAAAEPLSVGFLIRDGVYNTELTAPWDMFHHTVFHTQPGMRVFTVAPSLDPVTSFEDLRVLPDYDFRTAPDIDVLVVPSCEHSMDSDLEDEEMLAWVRKVGGEADWILSLCDGAFVLAAAGLLDGKVSTTFPSDVARMRADFPELDVREGVSFVRDGNTITSVGGAPSFDAALYLCELLYGVEAARGIARGLVIDWDLEGIEHLAFD